jgi:catechol 2,3-dioxygenase-like lactoylglutathione lyase family enzyme
MTRYVFSAISFLLRAANGLRSQGIKDSVLFHTSGSFFALSVADMEASIKWYGEKFGLQPVMQLPKQNKVRVAVLSGGGLVVELIQNDDAAPLQKVAPSLTSNLPVHGIFKVGLIVDKYPSVLESLKERGIEIVHGPFPSRKDQPGNVIIRDNSGNLIQFFEKR